jgi:hypothetical protein
MLGVVNMVSTYSNVTLTIHLRNIQLGSLMTYGLGHIHSRLHSYQIIFLFCGCLTVAFSIVVL